MADNVGELTLAVQSALARVNGLKQESSDYAMGVIGNILGSGVRDCFVDPVAGNDNNDGLTVATAVKTLSKASSFTRYGMGLLNITLVNDTEIGPSVSFKSGLVQISGLTRSVKLIYDGNRIKHPFNGCNYLIFNLTIHLKKTLVGDKYNHMFCCHGNVFLFPFNCDLLIDDDADSYLMQFPFHSTTLLSEGNVLVNEGSSMSGHWIVDRNANTIVADQINIISNMRTL